MSFASFLLSHMAPKLGCGLRGEDVNAPRSLEEVLCDLLNDDLEREIELMPNHVTHAMRVRGRPEHVAEFMAKHVIKGCLSLHSVIPMPPEIKSTTSWVGNATVEWWEHALQGGNTMDPYGQYRLWKEDHEGTLLDMLKSDERYAPGREAAELRVAARLATGFSDWYAWSKHHWGTKWNTYNGEEPKLQESGEDVSIRFDTAWCSPTPVFRKLAEMYPNLLINVVALDEGHCFWLKATMVAGEYWEHEGNSEELRDEALLTRVYLTVYGHPPELFDEDEDDVDADDEADPDVP